MATLQQMARLERLWFYESKSIALVQRRLRLKYRYRRSPSGKYSVFPSGKLHIREAKQQDGFRSYRCQTKHRLTGETKQSSAGQLIVTESHSTVPPRITHREEEVKVQLGEIAFLPCAAEAYPVPTHRWYKQESGRTNAIVSSQRVFLMGGTLVFRRAIVMDSGKYVCLVNNSVGQERIETELIVVDVRVCQGPVNFLWTVNGDQRHSLAHCSFISL
ncbi:Down syndrome cell adhesion molecule-like protein 1 [Araneus ventricosus]|uniref:Down syndrome cell adhesion molecule-like protein 1 n=1 Tax=Araneus ventricosus TaxID=182803 RepID=A0A4Y2T085_ARAVE|nr:Down syndrome cell adhesion molecule-like protein 1 [Araneus ventricosus]